MHFIGISCDKPTHLWWRVNSMPVDAFARICMFNLVKQRYQWTYQCMFAFVGLGGAAHPPLSFSLPPQRCLTLMNRGFAFGLVNHYMCHFGLKDPKVLQRKICTGCFEAYKQMCHVKGSKCSFILHHLTNKSGSPRDSMAFFDKQLTFE